MIVSVRCRRGVGECRRDVPPCSHFSRRVPPPRGLRFASGGGWAHAHSGYTTKRHPRCAPHACVPSQNARPNARVCVCERAGRRVTAVDACALRPLARPPPAQHVHGGQRGAERTGCSRRPRRSGRCGPCRGRSPAQPGCKWRRRRRLRARGRVQQGLQAVPGVQKKRDQPATVRAGARAPRGCCAT